MSRFTIVTSSSASYHRLSDASKSTLVAIVCTLARPVEGPSYDDVLRAREIVTRHLPRTPVFSYPALSERLGCELFIKHENHQPVGSFKIRGGINLLASLSPEERASGVISATRGNHGLSLAYAARLFDMRAVLVVPHGNNPEKNEAMRAWGAEVVEHGVDFDEAREHVEELARTQGLRYVHSANEPLLIAGVGTYALELFEDVADLDTVIVPVGLGSGICGTCLVRGVLSPETRVIGVQAERAASVYLSWREKRIVTTDSADTIADGLATRVPAEMTLELIWREVDDFVTVSEEALAGAIRDLLRYTHNLAEAAGAAGLAAIDLLRERLRGQRAAIVLTGGNIDTETLRSVLAPTRARTRSPEAAD
jgi:threonine dehydratase